MKKRVLAIVLTIIIICISALWVFSETSPGGSDETVYALLKNNGDIDFIKVINRVQRDDFTAEYIERAVTDKELPVKVTMDYYAGDSLVTADKVIGYSGKIAIKINVKENPACEESLKGRYMTQIQIPVNLDNSLIEKFDGTLSVITGKTATLTYTVLPGQTAGYELVLDSRDFRMDSIQIVLTDYSDGISSQIQGLSNGVEDLGYNMDQILEGTAQLKSGMEKLSQGAITFDNSVSTLKSGASALAKGMDSYSSGLGQYEAGISAAVSGIESTGKGLSGLSDGMYMLIKGYDDLYGAALQLESGHKELANIAQRLVNSSDPEVKALCSGIIMEAQGIGQLTGGLSKANSELSRFSAGLDELKSGMDQFISKASLLAEGYKQLQTGFDGLRSASWKLSDGIVKFSSGASTLAASAKNLPGSVEQLYEGQRKFREGIGTMEAEISKQLNQGKKTAPVSFVDGKTKVKSQQFILKLPALEKSSVSKEVKSSVSDNRSWIEKIWERIKNLF